MCASRSTYNIIEPHHICYIKTITKTNGMVGCTTIFFALATSFRPNIGFYFHSTYKKKNGIFNEITITIAEISKVAIRTVTLLCLL